MKILLTSGATREPIDSVRFLSNISTGATGAAIADALTAAGHSVVLLGGEGSVRPRDRRVDQVTFGSTDDLAQRSASLLGSGEFAVAIQAAAISDYRPVQHHDTKLTSDAPELSLCLVPTPKLLPQLQSWSPRPLRVLGFKLTHDADPAERERAVGRLFARGGVEAVVHNDVRSLARQGAQRTFHLFQRHGTERTDLVGLPALLAALVRWVEEAPTTAGPRPAFASLAS